MSLLRVLICLVPIALLACSNNEEAKQEQKRESAFVKTVKQPIDKAKDDGAGPTGRRRGSEKSYRSTNSITPS